MIYGGPGSKARFNAEHACKALEDRIARLELIESTRHTFALQNGEPWAAAVRPVVEEMRALMRLAVSASDADTDTPHRGESEDDGG
jgi:hypothetical protein